MNRNEEAATRYMAGATLEEIGRELGVTRERVRQILDKQGVKRRSRVSAHRNNVSRVVDQHADAINAAFDRLLSIRAVAAEYKGVVPGAIVREILAPRASQQRKQIATGAVRRFSDEDIKNAIVRAEKDGFSSSQSYAKWRAERVSEGEELPSVATISVRYGSWSSARREAGAVVVRSRKSQSCRVFSDEDINSAIRRFVSAATAKGVHPSARAYDEWARKVGNAPLLSTIRARTGRKWSSLTYRPQKG